MKETVVVELTPPAQSDLKALWEVYEEVEEHLRSLKKNPQKGHLLSGSLQGVRSLEFSLQGSGQYRAAYLFLEKENKVTVFLVGPHENFYDEANRRAKLLKGLVKRVREENREKSKKKPTRSASGL
jgi:mRNA-degrading endonuclease RelE of RelBE toxin-antitoxin system